MTNPFNASPPPEAVADRRTGEFVRFPDGTYPTRDQLLMRWRDAAQAVMDAQAVERTLRETVVAVMTDPQKVRGTETIQLGNDWRLQSTKIASYKLKAKFEGAKAEDHERAVEACRERLDALGYGEWADKLIRWKPELAPSAYNDPAIPEAVKAEIDNVLIIDAGTPQVKLLAPGDTSYKDAV